jgi:hypothetical protein
LGMSIQVLSFLWFLKGCGSLLGAFNPQKTKKRGTCTHPPNL